MYKIFVQVFNTFFLIVSFRNNSLIDALKIHLKDHYSDTDFIDTYNTIDYNEVMQPWHGDEPDEVIDNAPLEEPQKWVDPYQTWVNPLWEVQAHPQIPQPVTYFHGHPPSGSNIQVCNGIPDALNVIWDALKNKTMENMMKQAAEMIDPVNIVAKVMKVFMVKKMIVWAIVMGFVAIKNWKSSLHSIIKALQSSIKQLIKAITNSNSTTTTTTTTTTSTPANVDDDDDDDDDER